MKDFQDFIERIDNEEINTIYATAIQSGEDSKTQAFTIALELLKRYHQWLREESQTSA